MKNWQTWLISLSIILLFIIPFSKKLIPNIRYIIKDPQSLQENNHSGSINIQLENRLFATVKAKVTFWGATTSKHEFEFTDYKAEIPFQLNEEAKVIIYQIRLTSIRGDYAFIGRIEAPKSLKQEGLQIITERKRYRPGDTIRALMLDYSVKKGLKPNKNFEIAILDNHQNIIEKQQLHSQDGLLIHEFSLAEKKKFTLTALASVNSQNIWTAILSCRILKQPGFNDESLKKLTESVIKKIINQEGLYITPCNRRKAPALVTTTAFALELANAYELPKISSLKAILLQHQKGSQCYDIFSTAFAIKALSKLSDPQMKILTLSCDQEQQQIQIDPDSIDIIKIGSSRIAVNI